MTAPPRRQLLFAPVLISASGVLAGCALIFAALSFIPAAPDRPDRLAAIAFLLAMLGALAAWGARRENAAALANARVDFFDAAITLVVIVPILLWLGPNGVPAFRQDWFISPDGATFAHFLHAYGSAWQSTGLGFASPQAGFYPVIALWAVLTEAIGSHLSVILFLCSTLIFAALGARRAIMRFSGADSLVASAGALWYTCGAMTVNRLVAGHGFHILGAALLPFVLLLADSASRERSGRWRASAALAAVIALAMPEPQVFVVCAVSAVCIALANGSVLETVSAVFVAGALNVPTFVAAALAPGDTYVLKRAALEWEIAQSASPRLLLAGAGYLARYWSDSAAAPSVVSAAVFTMLSWLGLPCLRRAAAAYVTWGSVCALLMLGVLGPLQGPLRWAFDNVTAASLFRELYDFAPAFFLSTGIAMGALSASLIRSNAYLRIAAAAVAVAAAFPYVTISYAPLVPIYGNAKTARALAHLPGDARIFWIPGVYPLSLKDGRGNGYDPYFLTAGTHASVFAMLPPMVVAHAYALLSTAPKEAATLLASMGCGFIAVDRATMRTPGTPVYPNAFSILDGARSISTAYRSFGTVEVRRLTVPAPQVAAAAVVAVSGNIGLASTEAARFYVDDPANASAAAEAGVFARPLHFTLAPSLATSANPLTGLANAQIVWQTVPPASALPGVPLAGVSQSLALGPGVLVAAGGEVPVDDYLPTQRTVHFHGPFGLIGVRTGPSHVRKVLAPQSSAAIAYRRTDDSTFAILGVKGQTDALLLRETYDPGWALEVNGRPRGVHFRADGWANGWLVQLREGDHAVIRFQPQRFIALAETCSKILWILLAFAIIVAFLKANTRQYVKHG